MKKSLIIIYMIIFWLSGMLIGTSIGITWVKGTTVNDMRMVIDSLKTLQRPTGKIQFSNNSFTGYQVSKPIPTPLYMAEREATQGYIGHTSRGNTYFTFGDTTIEDKDTVKFKGGTGIWDGVVIGEPARFYSDKIIDRIDRLENKLDSLFKNPRIHIHCDSSLIRVIK